MKYIVSNNVKYMLLPILACRIFFGHRFQPDELYEGIHIFKREAGRRGKRTGFYPAPELQYADLKQGGQVEVRWCTDTYVAAAF